MVNNMIDFQSRCTYKNSSVIAADLISDTIGIHSEAAAGVVLLKACNFIKKETLGQLFSCEFCKIVKNTFFTEHIQATASVHCRR